MRMMLPTSIARPLRSGALALLVAAGSLGCVPDPPIGGLPEYRDLGALRLPGGILDTWNRNFMVRRVDLSIDTRLGTQRIGAAYNSFDNRWIWSFEVTYDGTTFVDATGARHAVANLGSGQTIPGTHWVKVDANTIKSRGGLVHHFAASGRLSVLRWASGAYPRLVYVGSPIDRIEQCYSATECYGVATLTRDSGGRVTRIDDRAGRTALFTYDAAGRLAQARDPLDLDRQWTGFRYEYGGQGSRLSAIINSEGERVELIYTGTAGALFHLRQIGEGNPAYQISGLASQTLVVDPLGHTTEYTWDSVGRTRRIRQVDLEESADFEWSGLRLAKQTLPGGVVTRWQYNGEVTTETQPSGNVVQTVYEPSGVDRERPYSRPVRSITDSLGPVETRGYGGQGRLLWIENGAGDRMSFTYDALGEIATRTLPSGQVLRYGGYGEHGHPTTVDAGGGLLDERTYDAVGNLLTGTDVSHILAPGGPGILSRAFDGDRNLSTLQMKELAGSPFPVEPIVIQRRSDGRIRRIVRPYGGEARFHYDALGHLRSRDEKVDGSWRATVFGRDLRGNETSVALSNGMRREMDYDPLGRTLAIRLERSGVLEQTLTQTYTDGRLTSKLDSVYGTPESRTYDVAGRTAAVTLATGEQLVFEYDLRSREVGLDFRRPNGTRLRKLSFGYDLADRETLALDGAALLRTRSFTDGQLASETFGNGIRRDYTYDPEAGYLTSSTSTNAAAQVVESTTIVRRAGILFEGPGSLVYDTSTDVVVYGVLHSGLTEIHGLSEAALGRRPVDFLGYDLVNNAGATTSAFNAERNRLLSAFVLGGERVGYDYDTAGFATARNASSITWTAGGWPASAGSDIFEWDTKGNLRSLRRAGQTTRFLYGGLVRADASGSPQALELEFVRLDLDGPARLYRHLDFRHNVKLVTDQDGDVATHYTYRVYGDLVDTQTLGAEVDDRTFAQGIRLSERLLLLGSRLYDPVTGFFLSPDPVYQVINQYVYAGANPIEFGDPDGRNPFWWFVLGLEAGRRYGDWVRDLDPQPQPGCGCSGDADGGGDGEGDGDGGPPGGKGSGGKGSGGQGGKGGSGGDGGDPSGAPIVWMSGGFATPGLGIFGFAQHPLVSVLVAALTWIGVRTRRRWSQGRLG